MNKVTQLFTVFAVTVGFLYLPTQSTAQISETSIDTGKVYTLDEVIISASRYEEDPSSVGRNVTVINREEIENSLHLSIAGLLAEQQSVHMIGNRQTPGSLQQGFIRNTNSSHSIVMIDGVRISDPSTVNNNVDLSEISLAGVERIEIVRGSHSTLYGSSAIGGVINIITQKKGSEGFNLDLVTNQSVSNQDAYATRNNLMFNYTLPGGFYVDAGLSQHYSSGFDATVDTVTSQNTFNPQDRDEFRKLDILGKVGYKTKNADLYLSYRNEGQAGDLDQGAYNDDGNAGVEFGRDLLAYGASYKFSDQIKFGYEGAYSELTRDFVNDSSIVDASGNYDGTYVETNASGSNWENSLTATFSGDFLKSIVGLESSVQTMDSRNYVYSRSQFGVFEQVTDLDSLNLKESINSAFIHTEINGGFIANSIEPFSLVLGSRVSDHNKFGTHFTYEINPKIRISNSALVYAALTTGFNAPSLYQLNTPEQSFGAYTNRGNSNLEPEKSVSYELGWKQDFGEFLNFEISLFRTEVSDVIEYVYLWEGSTAINDLAGSDYLGDTYLNISRQNINGFELGMQLRPISQLSLSGNLTLTESSLIFSQGDIKESYTGGNHVQVYESGEFVSGKKELSGLTRRPQLSAALHVVYNPISKLRIKLSTQYVGSRDDVFYSANLGPFGAQDRTKVSGYNITDLGVGYDLSERISVSAKVNNMFNTDFVEINGYQTRGRGLILSGRYNLGSF